jgi:hypothetical protein
MDMGAQFLFLSVAVTAGLSFVAVMVWLGNLKNERTQFYRSETMKKIAESGSAAAALEYAREIERMGAGRTRSGLRLGGLITMAAGTGLMVFLHEIERQEPIYLIALIPMLVGGVMFLFSLLPSRPD